MPNWNLTLSPIISIENLQKSSEQHLFDQLLLFFLTAFPNFIPSGRTQEWVRRRTVPCLLLVWVGKKRLPTSLGRACGGCPVPTSQSTQIPKEVTTALVLEAAILLLGNLTWQRASGSALHCIPRLGACAGPQLPKNRHYSANRWFFSAAEGGTWQKPP